MMRTGDTYRTAYTCVKIFCLTVTVYSAGPLQTRQERSFSAETDGGDAIIITTQETIDDTVQKRPGLKLTLLFVLDAPALFLIRYDEVCGTNVSII